MRYNLCDVFVDSLIDPFPLYTIEAADRCHYVLVPVEAAGRLGSGSPGRCLHVKGKLWIGIAQAILEKSRGDRVPCD